MFLGRNAERVIQFDGEYQHEGNAGEDDQRQRQTGRAQDNEGYRDLDGGDEEFLRTVMGKFGDIE